jgi:hypothetical protein
VVNAVVVAADAFLFCLAARSYLERSWAVLATLVFCCMPGVFFSGVVLKTESLQLLEVLAAMIATNRLADGDESLRWHVVAAVAAALALATKLNPMPLFMYLSCVVVMRFSLKRPVSMKASAVFAVSFAIAILLGWRNLWTFGEVIKYWERDIYFQSGAAFLGAVPELLAFPYGRYSSFFLTTLPAMAGFGVWVLFWPALALRTIPTRLLLILGVSVLLHLAVALSFTRLRWPFSFTPVAPFFVLGAVSLLRRMYRMEYSKSRLLWPMAACVLAAGLAGFSFQSRECMTGMYYGYFKPVREFDNVKFRMSDPYETGENDPARGRGAGGGRSPSSMLLLGGYTMKFRTQDRPTEREDDSNPIRKIVESRRPANILLIDSYLLNMCKYRDNPVYADNCIFFRELVEGRAGYRVHTIRSAEFPSKQLFFDPELRSFTYYLLRATNQEGGPR